MKTKVLKTFEEFCDFVDECKTAKTPMYVNQKKISNTEDFEDVYDNNHVVQIEFSQTPRKFELKIIKNET